jgi:hypothetical protein
LFNRLGVTAEVPSNILFNYTGVALCIVSLFAFVFIKTEEDLDRANSRSSNNEEDREPVFSQRNVQSDYGSVLNNSIRRETDLLERFGPRTRRILGVILSLFSGIMYAVSMTPLLYIESNYPNASQNFNDYAYSYGVGIFLGFLLFLVAYCALRKGQPVVYPKVIIPGLIAGLHIYFLIRYLNYNGTTTIV